MTKGTMIVAFAAATLLTAGAAVAKPPGGGGVGAGATGLPQGKALGSGGWTTGNPPGFGNTGPANENFRKGWDTRTGPPPGWTNQDNSRSWTTTPYGIEKHPQ
jgi:hypothetical protein